MKPSKISVSPLPQRRSDTPRDGDDDDGLRGDHDRPDAQELGIGMFLRPEGLQGLQIKRLLGVLPAPRKTEIDARDARTRRPISPAPCSLVGRG